MKYEVIRRFRDKYSGEIILPGSTFISEETDRINDLINRGMIKEFYDSMTKKELASMLDEKGIKYSEKQTKAELIALLGGD